MLKTAVHMLLLCCWGDVIKEASSDEQSPARPLSFLRQGATVVEFDSRLKLISGTPAAVSGTGIWQASGKLD